MNMLRYEISTSKLEEAIVHFVVIGEFEMVAELCELLLDCEGTSYNDALPTRALTLDLPPKDLPEIIVNADNPEIKASTIFKIPTRRQTFRGVS